MVFEEIPWRHPYAAFAPLAGADDAHLLHAGDLGGGGWSVIVAAPTARIIHCGDPEQWLAEIDRQVATRRQENAHPQAPFLSGLVGFIGYEALGGLEPTLRQPPSPYALPDAAFGIYDAAALFHRQARRAYISGRSDRAAQDLLARIGDTTPPAAEFVSASHISSNFSRPAYQSAVANVIEHIRDGDFFQANIAQTLTAELEAPVKGFSVYQKIAKDSDADYGAFLQYENGCIISNSPERFFQVNADRRIHVAPIKGTRPRGETTEDDRAFAKELLNDGKDRAENIMIADLMRNDLSKLCADFTLREDAICELMTLTGVHHLVSKISATLRPDIQWSDIFRALFPSGSITGAPKIEAMKTIAAVEGAGRGPYCGAIGYIDDRGVADFSVAIRTLVTDRRGAVISIPVGGGVTLRSDPASEYDETLVKAGAALSAVNANSDRSN